MTSTSIDKLTEIRDEIYGGSWTDMLSDLKARLIKRPYNFRLVQRIEEDIRTIEETLKKYKD